MKRIIVIAMLVFLIPLVSCNSGTAKIVSLNLVNETSGSFFLGCGSIDGTLNYYYYFEENGGYKLGNTPCINVTIFEDSTNETAYCVFDPAYIKKSTYIKELHVPKGTIIREYNLEIK
jgi:hypothetical protein